MRQISVTGLFRHYGIRSVLEIGAYITPVCRISKDDGIHHILVEPFAKETSCPNSTLVRKSLSDKDSYSHFFIGLPEPRAIVALGIDYPKPEDIGYLANYTSLIVLETPHTYEQGSQRLDIAMKECLKTNPRLKVIADFELNDRTEKIENVGEYLHMLNRRIVVLSDHEINPI